MASNLMVAENNPNISNWDADNGYYSGAVDRTYPRRISNALSIGALQLELRQLKNNMQFKRFDETATFVIYLHTQGERLHLNTHYFKTYPSERISILIKPTLITTSDGLRSYTPNQRQCYFNYERRLQFYQIYTKMNCLLECFASYMKSTFGCVIYDMPSMSIYFLCYEL